MIVDFKKKGDSQWKKHGQRHVQWAENLCAPPMHMLKSILNVMGLGVGGGIWKVIRS